MVLLQKEFNAIAPAGGSGQPIYSAGTAESRNATLSIPTLDKPTAWIDVYYPVLNTPLNHSVEILDEDGKPFWSAPLEEDADETDPDAGKYIDSVPAFHGLSQSGEVKGKLVFANYGRQEDYQALVKQGMAYNYVDRSKANFMIGVDLTGKIVLVKYGGIFRGLKVCPNCT